MLKLKRNFQLSQVFKVLGVLALVMTILVSPVMVGEADASEEFRRLHVSDYERNLMARTVYSEARGEPYKGQVAVAAVIINRVLDNRWPNNVEGVIFEPWAFTAVHDGQFWLTPNQTAYDAVEDALRGWDPSFGAPFYYNPVTATSSWIFTRQPVTSIGKHIFAY